MHGHRRAVLIGFMFLLLPSITWSLGSGEKKSTSSSNAPAVIRWVRAGNEQDPTKDRILLELQRRLNIKLQIIGIPWDQYPGKLNIMMAAHEQIDLANADPDNTLIQWARDGLLYSYDDLLKSGKYPYVKAVIDANMYKGLRIDGKAYYKPLGLCPQQMGYLIRQDWLDNLGLKMPTSIHEFYNVINAFAKDDPNKDGKNDTYGLYLRIGGLVDPTSTFNLAIVLNAYAINGGSGNFVTLPDGSLTRFEVSTGAENAARFVWRAVTEGLVNSDWLTLKQDVGQGPESDDFAAGKYGIARTSIPNVFIEKLKKLNPQARVSYLPPLKGENGVPRNSGTNGGFWWGNIIPKTAKNPDKVMELLNYSLTEQGRELTLFGIKGIHFTGVKQTTTGRIYTINKAEDDKDWNTQADGYLYPLAWGGLNYYEYAYIPIREYNFNYDQAFMHVRSWLPQDMAKGAFPNWQQMNSAYSIASPLLVNMDDKLKGNAQTLNSIYGEGWIKAVTSRTPAQFETNWRAMVQRWLDAGGKDIIDYANQKYRPGESGRGKE